MTKLSISKLPNEMSVQSSGRMVHNLKALLRIAANRMNLMKILSCIKLLQTNLDFSGADTSKRLPNKITNISSFKRKNQQN